MWWSYFASWIINIFISQNFVCYNNLFNPVIKRVNFFYGKECSLTCLLLWRGLAYITQDKWNKLAASENSGLLQYFTIIRQVFIMLCSGTTYVLPALKGNLVMTVYRHCPAATLSNLVNQAEQSNSTIYTLRQQILFVLLDDVCWRNFSKRKNTAPNPWTLSNGNCVFCLLWHIVAMCYLVIYLGPVPRHSHFREQVERPYQTDTHFVTFLKSTLFQSFIPKFMWGFVW